MLGRRGPAQASFTTPELKELGELADADVIVDPGRPRARPRQRGRAARRARRRAQHGGSAGVLRRAPSGKRRSARPSLLRIPGRDPRRWTVEAVEVVRNTLVADERGQRPRRSDRRARDHPVRASSCVASATAACRFRASPFDEERGTMLNRAGRVLDESGKPVPGVYCTGWIKRGPSGIIGTNKKDADGDRRRSLLEDRGRGDAAAAAGGGRCRTVDALLAERGVDVVAYGGWEAIDADRAGARRAAGPPPREARELGRAPGGRGRSSASCATAGRLGRMAETSTRRTSSGGAETRKAIGNFPISGEPIPIEVARWLAQIKAASARVNAELGLLDVALAERIAGAADRVAAGRVRRPVPARRLPDRLGHLVEHERERGDRGARRRRHPSERPREHGPVVERRLPVRRAPGGPRRARRTISCRRCVGSRDSLGAKAAEFDDVVKSGRTHLMDAVPVTLGQEFAGYEAQVRQGVERVEGDARPCRADSARRHGHRHRAEHPSASSPPVSAARLADESGLADQPACRPLRGNGRAGRPRRGVGSRQDGRRLADEDRERPPPMGSGPRAGLAEIFLPELQKGSSIMPGKVNPVIPEVVTQVAAQVIGNDAAITVGGLQGHFELNVFVPLMARNLLESINLLAAAARVLAEKCVDGIEANRERCRAVRGADALGRNRAQPVHRLRPRQRDRQGGGRRRAGRSERWRARRASPGRPRQRARLPRDGARRSRLAGRFPPHPLFGPLPGVSTGSAPRWGQTPSSMRRSWLSSGSLVDTLRACSERLRCLPEGDGHGRGGGSVDSAVSSAENAFRFGHRFRRAPAR